MKVCSSCGVEKHESEFQMRKASKDGFTASCKACLKARDKTRYVKERDYRAERHKAYMKTDAGKSSHAAANKRWKENNALRKAAQTILGNAVRDGKIAKMPCWVCGSEIVHAHHPYYSHPLEVVWLCPRHHKEIHTAHPH